MKIVTVQMRTLPSFGFLLTMITTRQRKASASTKMNSRRLRVCCSLTEPFISGGILKDFKKQCLVRSRRRIVKEAINALQTCAIYLLTFLINPTNQAISYARLTIHSSFYYIVHYPYILSTHSYILICYSTRFFFHTSNCLIYLVCVSQYSQHPRHSLLSALSVLSVLSEYLEYSQYSQNSQNSSVLSADSQCSQYPQCSP